MGKDGRQGMNAVAWHGKGAGGEQAARGLWTDDMMDPSPTVAFYAPMKPPDHPVPSGDRQIARGFIAALARAGFHVDLACRFRAWEGRGDASRQQRLERAGHWLADRLAERLATRPEATRPRLWFTYHLYHKAPDLIGPVLCREFGIPYAVAEPSHAPKRRTGPWAAWHAAAAGALARADAVFYLNPSDADCVSPLLKPGARERHLAPFTDIATYPRARRRREETRRALAAKFGLNPDRPWLIAAAMMRADVKEDSYRLLAEALQQVKSADWDLLIVGDGPARGRVEAMYGFAPGAAFLGALPAEELALVHGACDIAVWPSLNEAFGLSLLEAQAAGLPAVSGRNAGVANMIRDGETGILVPMGDAGALAQAVGRYLADPALRKEHGEAAQENTARRHSLEAAAAALNDCLVDLTRAATE